MAITGYNYSGINKRVCSRAKNKADSKADRKTLYLWAFALYLIAYNLNFTTFKQLTYLHLDMFYLGVRVFCALALMARIVSISQVVGFARWQIALFSICGCLAATSTAISGSWNILLLFLFVLAGRGIKATDLALVSFWCALGVAILTVTAGSLGFIATVTMYSVEGTVRNAPGFTHPNSLGVLLLCMTMSFAVLRFRKATVIDFFFYGLMYYLCSVVVFSRTSALCILLVGVLAILTTLFRGKAFDRTLILFGLASFIGLSLLTYCLMACYDSSVDWMHELNSLLSSRLALMNYFTKVAPPSLFGFNFDGVPVRYGLISSFICDNAYAHIVLESGLLLAALMEVAWVLTMVQAFRARNLKPAIFGLIIFSFVAFCETAAFFICINFSLIGISEALYSNGRLQKLETTGDAVPINVGSQGAIRQSTKIGFRSSCAINSAHNHRIR